MCVTSRFKWFQSSCTFLHAHSVIIFHVNEKSQNVFCCFLTKLCLTLLQPPWTVVHQAPRSMGFSQQECWSRLPFSSLGDLPDPGMEPASPALAGEFLTTEPPGKPIWELMEGQKTHIRVFESLNDQQKGEKHLFCQFT